MFQNFLPKKYILIFSLFLLFLFFGVYYFFVYLPTIQIRQIQSLQTARQSVHNGSTSISLTSLEQMVAQSASPSQKAAAEIILGGAYINQGMLSQGIEIFKQVSINTTYPVFYRIFAADSVLDKLNSAANSDFAFGDVFVGPIWGTFTQNQPQPKLFMAVRNAYVWVDSLSSSAAPSLVPSYALAALYSDTIRTDSSHQKILDIQQSQNYLQEGDNAYVLALQANTTAARQYPNALPPYTTDLIGSAFIFKDIALSNLTLAQVSGYAATSTAAAYVQTISMLEENQSDIADTGLARSARFQYASFLLESNSSANVQQIQKILEPIVTATNNSIQTEGFYQGFLKTYDSSSLKGTVYWQNMIGLSNVDPQFKQLLINLGWDSKSFQS